MEELLSREMRKALEETRVQIKKLDSRAMLSFLMRKIVEVLKVERVCIFEVLEGLEEFRLVMGEPEGKHGIGETFQYSKFKHLREVVETKSELQKKEPGLDSSIEHSKELIYVEGITAWLILPLLIEDEVIWVMLVDAKWPRTEFTAEEISFCLRLTDSAGLLLERDKRQRELDEKESMAEVGEVAAEAVHQIRNRLAPIGGLAKRLAKLAQDEKQKTYSETIVCDIEALEKILNDLLKFAESKKVNPIESDLNQLIKESWQAVELVDGKEINLNYQLSQLPLVMVDPEDIKEVFSRIFKNATEAIKEKGEILVKSRLKGSYIVIAITNNGSCINNEIIHQIFNPFFTTKGSSVGMGLAVVNKIVKIYDGEIKVETDESRQLTTFIVKLPVKLELVAERR